MFNTLIDIIGAVCAVLLVGYLVKSYARKPPKDGDAESTVIEDYLQKITRITGFSVYDTFQKSAENWHVPTRRIDQDFAKYLSSQIIPYYVKDFVRKSQIHIDELYRGKGTVYSEKRLWVFYSVLILLFWGGAVFISLYVFPNIWPAEFRANIHIGPP